LAKFVPNVLTADMLKRLAIPTEKFNASFEGMMKAGLERLTALQHANGAWGWYDNDHDDAFMTACAVHGLSECDRLGFKVDAVVLKRGREALRAIAREEKDLNRLAYETYVLGDEFGPLLERQAKLSSYAQALLALALHQAGRPEASGVAKDLAASVQGDHWVTPSWYYKWDDVSIETTAYAMQALTAVDPRSPLIAKGREWLLAQRTGNRWRSTKDTAVAIATLIQINDLEALAGAVGAERKEVRKETLFKKIGVTLNGGERREILVDVINPTNSRFEAHFGSVQVGTNTLHFQKLDEQSDFRFDLDLTQRLFDDRAVAETRGLDVKVAYDRPLERLRLGDEVVATVTVAASAEADYVMVQSPIPAGCEVVRGSGVGPFSRFEDRYEMAIFFLRSVKDQPVQLTYRMRCAFAGRFSVLPTWAGLMYNDEMYGSTAPTAARIVR
jgi:uncharacterized protein YfaS (alpha-2-macroglobulin family)